jgi:DNA-binding NarL/FixJ family response regulator
MPNSAKPKPARVLIVEDHPMFREHLIQLITRELGVTICGEADNNRDAMILLEKEKPDIAIVDLTLRGGSSGLELLKDIKALGLEVQVRVPSVPVPVATLRKTKPHPRLSKPSVVSWRVRFMPATASPPACSSA